MALVTCGLTAEDQEQLRNRTFISSIRDLYLTVCRRATKCGIITLNGGKGLHAVETASTQPPSSHSASARSSRPAWRCCAVVGLSLCTELSVRWLRHGYYRCWFRLLTALEHHRTCLSVERKLVKCHWTGQRRRYPPHTDTHTHTHIIHWPSKCKCL